MSTYMLTLRQEGFPTKMIEAATYVVPDGERPLEHVRFYESQDAANVVYSIAACDLMSIELIPDRG